jgi:hypothetical protein
MNNPACRIEEYEVQDIPQGIFVAESIRIKNTVYRIEEYEAKDIPQEITVLERVFQDSTVKSVLQCLIPDSTGKKYLNESS